MADATVGTPTRFLVLVGDHLELRRQLTGEEQEVCPIGSVSERFTRFLDQHFHCLVRRQIPHHVPVPD